MKKVFLTLVFGFLLFCSEKLFAQSIDEVTVGATFEIGRNSTGNCSRFGICTKRLK